MCWRHWCWLGLGCLWMVASLGEVQARSLHPWLGRKQRPKRSWLMQRISPPAGFQRRKLRRGTFGWWLRRLPLHPKGTPIMLHNGKKKPLQRHRHSVVALDIGRRDLQQCADAIMRLWGEYLWYRGMQRRCQFRFITGQPHTWKRWSRGDRFAFRGNRLRWRPRARRANRSYRNYRRYLISLMAWMSTRSLSRELPRVPLQNAEVGDLLLQSGSPGHAVLILDIVVDKRGRKRYLLGQSYMPAQSFHILRVPGSKSPWHRFPKRGTIQTAEWRFHTRDLARLHHLRSTR